MHCERDHLKYIYLMATATVVFWGVSFASVKTALSEASPFAVILLRFLMSLAVLAAAAAVRGELRLPSPHEAKILAVLGLWGFFFQLGVQTIAMETANSGTANWQMASSPALSAVFAAFFLNEKLSRRGIFGGLLAFAGVVVVLAFGKQGGGGSVAYNTGDFLITLSVVGWAAFMVLTRKLLRRRFCARFHAILGNGFRFGGGCDSRRNKRLRSVWLRLADVVRHYVSRMFLFRSCLYILVCRSVENPSCAADVLPVFTASYRHHSRLRYGRRALYSMADPRRRDDIIRRMDSKSSGARLRQFPRKMKNTAPTMQRAA